MHALLTRLAKERDHFSRLSAAAQRLLLSAVVYSSAYPLIFTFVNAFIFRQTHSAVAVAVYNFSMFFALPTAFWLNGLLLKRIRIHYIFGAGLFSQGLVASLVFFFPFTTLLSLSVFGFMQGLALGFYWANRNFITLETTTDSNRNYFSGLETLIGTVAGIITPVVLGVVIRSGEYTGTYPAESAYRVLGILVLFFLVYGGWIFMRAPLKNPTFKKIFIGWAPLEWNLARLQESSVGFYSGMSFFLPALITFTFVGKEGSLGVLQSAAALITVGLMYVVARKAQPYHRLHILAFNLLVLGLISGPLLIFFNAISAIIYLLFISFPEQLVWISANPITLKIIDQAEDGDATNNYAYVCDRELFLNIGRIASTLCFFGLTYFFSGVVALRVIPVLMGLSQIGVWWTARQLVRISSKLN